MHERIAHGPEGVAVHRKHALVAADEELWTAPVELAGTGTVNSRRLSAASRRAIHSGRAACVAQGILIWFFANWVLSQRFTKAPAIMSS